MLRAADANARGAAAETFLAATVGGVWPENRGQGEGFAVKSSVRKMRGVTKITSSVLT
jgi:hypothetical protein